MSVDERCASNQKMYEILFEESSRMTPPSSPSPCDGIHEAKVMLGVILLMLLVH